MKALLKAFLMLLTGCIANTGTAKANTITRAPIHSLISDNGSNAACISKPDGTLLPIDGNCLFYWYCSGGIPIKLPCPQDMEFSVTASGCIRKELADCGKISWQTTTPSYPPETSTATPTGSLKAACANRKMGDLVPYPGNCSKFLVCDYINPTEKDCAIGLHFNAILHVCDWPHRACCMEPSLQPAVPSTSTITTLIAITTETIDPLFEMCDNETIGTKVAYPADCRKYVACDDPKPVLYTCCNNLVFNAKLKICDLPEKIICSNTVTTSDPVTETTTEKMEPITSSTNIPTSESTTPQSNTTAGNELLNKLCYNQQEGSFVAYPDNCSKYIYCTSPIPIAYKCEKGRQFNANLQICDYPEDANCSIGTTETIPPLTTPSYSWPEKDANATGTGNVCCNQQIGANVSFPGDCSKFIVCYLPIPRAKSCPSGMHYNAATEQCDTIENAQCIDGSTTESTISPVDEITTTATPTALTTDPITDNNRITTTATPTALTTDPITEESTTITTPTELTTTSATDPTTENPKTTATDPMTEKPATTTVSPPSNNVCSKKPDSTSLPYPEDCSKYIYCKSGSPVLLPCIPNFYYDATTNKCSRPSSAGCPPEEQQTTLAPGAFCRFLPNGTLLQYKGDCSKLIFCNNGTDAILPCTNDFLFSPVEARCVRPELYKCPW